MLLNIDETWHDHDSFVDNCVRYAHLSLLLIQQKQVYIYIHCHIFLAIPIRLSQCHITVYE